jgi:uncharacterized protein YecA (UPF0149 family)
VQSLVDESTARGAPLAEPAARGPQRPCPCGSGKKFKFCHGKLS